MQLWTSFLIAFSALLPLVNPVGSALIFMGLVGDAPLTVFRSLARRVAIDNIIFLAVFELLGSSILKFFGISLPIVQISGGLVIVGLGWSMLNEKDAHASARAKQEEAAASADEQNDATLEDQTFYPFTFPITSGPGALVVMLTLSAHASTGKLMTNLLSHAGLFTAVIVISVLVYFCYAYAPRLTKKFPASTVNGVLRVMAFVVLCIGAQIAWNGLSSLLSMRK